MRPALAAAFGLSLVTLAGGHPNRSPSPTPQSASSGTAAISGVVTDGATGRPMAGVSVSLYSNDIGADERPFRAPSVLTDARGRFVFVDLPSAIRYALFASKAGYEGGQYEGPATATRAGTSVSIRLADGEWMQDATIRLWRPASLGGRVVDERGEAVVGAAVRAFSRHVVAGRQQLVQGPVATTDDRGVYRIAYLSPGRYVVAVLSVQATVPSATPDGARRLPLGGLEGEAPRRLPRGGRRQLEPASTSTPHIGSS